MHPPSLEYYYAKEYPNYPYQNVQNLLLALVMDTTNLMIKNKIRHLY